MNTEQTRKNIFTYISSAALACDRNDIKIKRSDGDGYEPTIEGIHGQYYCSGEGYW